MKEEIGSTEKNISQILFKLAVESAMVSNLLAAQIRVTTEQMDALRKTCSNVVAENNGVIQFEDAYRFQNR